MKKKKEAAPVTTDSAGFTKVELNGKPYLLKFDYPSIEKAEEDTGMGLLFGVDWRNLPLARIRAMLYASLLPAQPEITTKEVRELVKFENVAKLTDAFVDSWMNPLKEKKVVEMRPLRAKKVEEQEQALEEAA